MGGVDRADRLLVVCPYRYRTRKWTQQFMSHMIDLAVTNAWIQFKIDQGQRMVPKNKIPQLRSYKMTLEETIIENNLQVMDSQFDNSDSDHNVPVKKKERKTYSPTTFKKKTSEKCETYARVRW